MEPCFSSPEEKYKIYNYLQPHNDTIEFPNFEEWAKYIAELTEDKMIVSWNHYTTPLDSFGIMGEAARWLTKGLSPNHGLLHKFLTFELKDVNDIANPGCAVSVEKGRSGLLFQMAHTNDVVKHTHEGSVRQSVREHDCSKKKGFDGQLINNLTTLKKVLESRDKFVAYYSMLFNNCQQTVQGIHEELMDKSLNLKFHVPGTEGTFVVKDPRNVEVIEQMFPRWTNGNVQQFPEIPEPFAFELNVAVDDASKYQYDPVMSKQNVAKAFLNILPSEKGRKAVVSNLSKSRYEQALALTKDVPRAIIEQISEMWSATFELVLTLEHIGVVIIAFQESQKDADQEALLKMMDLASEIEKVPRVASEDSVHVINVAFGMEKTKISPLKKQKLGYLVHISLSREDEHDLHKIESQLAACLYSISDKLSSSALCRRLSRKKSKKKSKFVIRFTTKLFILQNLVNDENLIHNRVVNQEFGREGVCIWTKAQRAVLDEAKYSFLKGEPIHWNVSGCFGSGKTMVLMQLARDFVEINNDGNILILLHPKLKNLMEYLQNQVNISDNLRTRVQIGSDISTECVSKDIKLILVDEFSFHLINEGNSKFDLILYSVLVGHVLLKRLPAKMSRKVAVEIFQQAFSSFDKLPKPDKVQQLSPFALWFRLPEIIRLQCSGQPQADREYLAQMVQDFSSVMSGWQEAKLPESLDITNVPKWESIFKKTHIDVICQSLQWLLLNPSIGVFSSYILISPIAQNIFQDYKHFPLEGNLRSSTEIVKLIAAFQKWLFQTVPGKIDIQFNLTNSAELPWSSPLKITHHLALPCVASLQMYCKKPTIVKVQDSTTHRTQFIDRCLKLIQAESRQRPKIMVSCLMQPGLEEVLHERVQKDEQLIGRVIFQNFSDILGCQYQSVIMILDLPLSFNRPEKITMIMSRATISLSIVVNTFSPIPAFRRSAETREVEVCIPLAVNEFFAKHKA